MIKSFIGGGGGDGGAGDVKIPEMPKDGEMPDREEMMKTIEQLQKAQKAASAAQGLKQKAMAMTSGKEREKMLRESFDKEMEANGHSKMAKRMQSGGWQGLGFGGGIGAATGLGLGAGLGTLLGAITAVPTAGIGMLVGTGVGAIHGPFVKLGGGKNGKVEEVPFEDADTGRVVDAMEAEQQKQIRNGTPSGRKKPRKIEIRNKKNAEHQAEAGEKVQTEPDVNKESSVTTGPSEESKPPRRKPKKIEIRSGKEGGKPAPAKS